MVLFGFLIGFERGSAKLRLACGPCRGRTLAKTRKRGCKTAEKQGSKKIDPPGVYFFWAPKHGPQKGLIRGQEKTSFDFFWIRFSCVLDVSGGF